MEITLIEYDFNWGTRFPRRTAQWYVEGRVSRKTAIEYVRTRLLMNVNEQAVKVRDIVLGRQYDVTYAV